MHIKDNNNSPHGKLTVSSIFFHFLANFQTKTSPHMFSIFTHVMKPVRDTNSESGLPVVLSPEKRDFTVLLTKFAFTGCPKNSFL